MIDVSDGLAQDLGHLLTEGTLGANLYENNLPISEALNSLCLQNKYNHNYIYQLGNVFAQ